MTTRNHIELLDCAGHKSKRDVEELVARTRPRPDAPAVIRKLPQPKPPAPSGVEGLTVESDGPTLATGDINTPSPGEPSAPPPRRAEVKPLAPERYRIQLTAGPRDARQASSGAGFPLRHTIPDGNPAAIFDKAITLLLKELSEAKHAATVRPRPARPNAAPSENARHIPPRCDGLCGSASRRRVLLLGGRGRLHAGGAFWTSITCLHVSRRTFRPSRSSIAVSRARQHEAESIQLARRKPSADDTEAERSKSGTCNWVRTEFGITMRR